VRNCYFWLTANVTSSDVHATALFTSNNDMIMIMTDGWGLRQWSTSPMTIQKSSIGINLNLHNKNVFSFFLNVPVLTVARRSAGGLFHAFGAFNNVGPTYTLLWQLIIAICYQNIHY